jgi:hypothetical protein
MSGEVVGFNETERCQNVGIQLSGKQEASMEVNNNLSGEETETQWKSNKEDVSDSPG